jgi:membrane-associated phospholipid phosphatase
MRLVTPFDQWADAQLEHLRGHELPDALFSAASLLGDFSLIWHIIGAARGIGSEERAEQSMLFAVLIGGESLLVNQGIKRVFRRVRPTETGDDRFRIRKPTTSSFPSGHASAAFFAATVLTSWSGTRTAPLWFAMAGVVATSRVYVRIHHASDIVAGGALGLALGQGALAGLRSLRGR